MQRSIKAMVLFGWGYILETAEFIPGTQETMSKLCFWVI